MKANHERWVSEALTEGQQQPKPVRLRRIEENIPTRLLRLTSGREVLDLIIGAAASSMEHDELESQEEVDMVGGFLQDVKDYGEMGSDLEPRYRTQAAFSLTESLQRLDAAGFEVFGALEIQRVEGGLGAPRDWRVAILQVLRATNPAIRQLKVEPG